MKRNTFFGIVTGLMAVIFAELIGATGISWIILVVSICFATVLIYHKCKP